MPILITVVIPWLILGSKASNAGELSLIKVIAIFLFVLGLIIMFLSQRKVYKPTQWTKQEMPINEPNHLVVEGIYRYTRNPMMDGLYLILIGEALFFKSWQIFYFLLFVLAVSVTVILLLEEPGLEKKFGDEYRKYKKNVSRFIPSLF